MVNHYLAKGSGGGSSADILPALTCVCGDAKVDATVKCAAACGSLASMITTQKDNMCKDPKAFVDAIAAKMSGGQLPTEILLY
jgi:hypothetical protein